MHSNSNAHVAEQTPTASAASSQEPDPKLCKTTESEQPELLEVLLGKHLSDIHSVQDLHASRPPERNVSLKIVVTRTEQVLVFIREIHGTLENYNTIVSNQTFGPELVQQADFTAIQLELERSAEAVARRQLGNLRGDSLPSDHNMVRNACPEVPPNVTSLLTPSITKRCLYIIRLRDTGIHNYICSVMYDKRFLSWYKSERHR